MNLQFLDFEQPVAELQAKIRELRLLDSDEEVNLSTEIARLEKLSEEKTRQIFSKLSTWQKVQIARHPQRPYTKDYIELIFTEFDECHGDRHFSDGAPIMTGLARLDGMPVMVMGHQKGRKTAEKLQRNFGLATPEAYRKALRIMKMAEKFHLPLITFIDTQGAYPGIGAEQRNQSEAIARNLYEMFQLRTPIISVVIGEGGSGGALAIGVADRVMMMEYSIYSVISPEGCASILWKSADQKELAAEAMGLTADRLFDLKLIDKVIPEPLGGAHRDYESSALQVKKEIVHALKELQQFDIKSLLDQRYQKFMGMGIAN